MQRLNDNENGPASKYHIHQFGSEPNDLCIRIGLQSFNLHRSIAAMRSKYLADLIKNKPLAAITELDLGDIKAETFLEICWWMYGNQLQIAAHNFCAVWNAAKKLQILELVEKCRQYMNSIGSHNKSPLNQGRNFQNSAVNKTIQPQRNFDKAVNFTSLALQIGHPQQPKVSEQRSGTEDTPNRKPVSLQKLLGKKKVECEIPSTPNKELPISLPNIQYKKKVENDTIPPISKECLVSLQNILCKKKVENEVPSSSSEEWLTISEEEIIGLEDEDSVPRSLHDRATERIQGFEVGRTIEKTHPRLLRSADPQKSWKTEENPDMVVLKTNELPKLAFLVDRSHLTLNSTFLKNELLRSKGNYIMLPHVDNQTVSNVLQWSLGGHMPLTINNVRSTLQLCSQLQMTDLLAKCLEFWRNCIRDYMCVTQAEVNSAALMAQARSDWPLLGPYPFLINLIASRMQRPKEDPCVFAKDRDSGFSHAHILTKALLGHNPRSTRIVIIPPSPPSIKPELPPPVPSPSKPAVPASIKILGLRRTLELLNSRKTHPKPASNKPKEPLADATAAPAPMPNSRTKATEVKVETKATPKQTILYKNMTSLRALASRKDSIRKRNVVDKGIK